VHCQIGKTLKKQLKPCTCEGVGKTLLGRLMSGYEQQQDCFTDIGSCG